MTRDAVQSESDAAVHEEIFRTLLRTPHRSVDETLDIHRTQLKRDPELYGKLTVHAVHNGECAVRDVQDVFVATLFTSDFLEHRQAAWVMLQDFPPHRVERVLHYITGYSEVVVHRSIDDPMPTNGQFGLTYEPARYGKSYHDVALRGQAVPPKVRPIGRSLRAHLKTSAREMTITRYQVKHEYHNRWANRIVQSAVRNYLRFREREDNRMLMEGAILRMRRSLLTLYKKMRIRPIEWVENALFKGQPPEGSRIEAMQKLIAEDDPTVQATIIVDAKLPYPVVRSLIKAKTPSTTLASIIVMSPQEVLANLGMLKRDGAFDNPEIKEVLDAKLAKVKTAKKGKVDAFKGVTAKEAVADLDEKTKKLMTDITDEQLKLHGTIRARTFMLIDKSASMTDAIDTAKQLGAALAQAGGDKFAGACLFGTQPRRVAWKAADGDITKFSAWQEKLKMQNADGGTDLGACIPLMIRDKIDVEQILIITDEGENGRPYFYERLPEYKAAFGHIPNIVIIRLGRHACSNVERTCKRAGATVDVLSVADIDKISIPNVIQLLSKKSIFDLIQDVLDLSLPSREEWIAKHQTKPKTKRNRKKVELAKAE